ncbi:hypothetical protein NliqN6_0617 [Naganishia liquefaciens]|uniref:Uncharacterized protein n=1 Tax=Naganishia liquefaciens TaxID=104408 RepID=A0A8H3TNA3_9TREE|nr:hypothetical protein NliqN6_0617 [Naganishia liquefaciens]
MHAAPTIDPDSPLLVAKATAALALLGATTGGTLAVLRAQHPLPLVLGMGLNGAVAGLSFFGIREYVVSPLLVASLDGPGYRRRRQLASASAPAVDVVTPTNEISLMRNDRVMDSALAGGIAGSSISGLVRGRRTIPASFITSALITAALQYTTNTIRVTRVQTLLARQSQSQSQPQPQSDTSVPVPSSTEPSAHDAPTTTTTWLDRIASALGKWSPVRKLSDDEYAQILRRQKAEVQEALDAWEQWMGATGASGTSPVADGAVAPRGKRPEINVEQATRELDSLERKIRALEDKVRGVEG